MKKIKCAVIGVGYLGQYHAEKYAHLEQAELVGVVDPNPTRAQEIAAKYHATAYTDYRELIGKVDAVSIVTPTLLHYEIAHFFLSQGVHVLVEKPITTTVEQADALIALAAEKKVLLQVGHLERFNSAMLSLNEILDDPRFIESQRIAPFTPRGADVNVILDLMIHDIDLIASIIDSPISKIMASGAPILTSQIDIANVRLEFENGCIANVTASRAGIKTERRMRIFQHDAYISINLHEKRLSIYRKGNGEMFPGIPSVDMKQLKFSNNDAIKAEISAFLDSILYQKPVLVDGQAGRNALKIALDISNAIQEDLQHYYARQIQREATQKNQKKIMIVAGEASGEQRGSELVEALQKIDNTFIFFGSGGRAMQKAGVETLVNCADLSVMGLGDVLFALPRLWHAFQTLKSKMQTDKPDLLVLIDFAGFNLRLAAIAKKLKIPVLFYISPQVWASRPWRVKKIARLVDHLAAIFPFEPAYYSKVNLPVTYVGHPLTRVVKSVLTASEAKEKWRLTASVPLIGLLPGSRLSEIKYLLPVLLKSAEKIKEKLNAVEFILPLASTINLSLIEEYIQKSSVQVKVVENESYEVMNACDALIIASGTATLEAGLLKKPMVVVYKAPPITAFIGRRFLTIPNVALCNIVAEKRIVKELLQSDANPELITQEILTILQDSNYREKMLADLETIPAKLGNLEGASNVAKIALKMLRVD